MLSGRYWLSVRGRLKTPDQDRIGRGSPHVLIAKNHAPHLRNSKRKSSLGMVVYTEESSGRWMSAIICGRPAWSLRS